MRMVACVLGVAVGLAAGAAQARAPEHESYLSRQLSVQQQQLDIPLDPALAAGQLLVITPQTYQPPPPPFRLRVAP